MEVLKSQKVPMRMEEAKGKAGRTCHSKGFHSFRRTLPTLLAAVNCPPDLRKAIVGHSLSDVHPRYTHHNLKQMQYYLDRAMNKIL